MTDRQNDQQKADQQTGRMRDRPAERQPEGARGQKDQQTDRRTCRQPPLAQLPLGAPQVRGVLSVAASVRQRGTQQLLEATQLNTTNKKTITQIYTHIAHYAIFKISIYIVYILILGFLSS